MDEKRVLFACFHNNARSQLTKAFLKKPAHEWFVVMKEYLLPLLLLTAGIGIEIYVVSFQIWFNMNCVYCLSLEVY